jgi:hypothetical protein
MAPDAMTDRHCNACDQDKPISAFRSVKPRRPGWTDRHSTCTPCEREAARLRAADRYANDPAWRAKQIVNASIQRERQRHRGTE